MDLKLKRAWLIKKYQILVLHKSQLNFCQQFLIYRILPPHLFRMCMNNAGSKKRSTKGSHFSEDDCTLPVFLSFGFWHTVELPSDIGAYLSNHRMHGTTYPTNHELKGLTVQISAILMVEWFLREKKLNTCFLYQTVIGPQFQNIPFLKCCFLTWRRASEKFYCYPKS